MSSCSKSLTRPCSLWGMGGLRQARQMNFDGVLAERYSRRSARAHIARVANSCSSRPGCPAGTKGATDNHHSLLS
jgi:hypothetical protein